MKKIIMFSLLISCCQAFAQINAPAWQSASSGNGSSGDEVRKLCTDKNGNYYIAGSFSSSKITFGTYTLTNAGNTSGSSDIFITKYDATGNVVWAKRDGGASSEVVLGLCLDRNDNLVITGSFTGSGTVLGTTTYANSNFNFTDFLVAKYDSAGNILWSRTAGGQYDERGNDVSCDGNGNIYITGTHGNVTLQFGTVTLPGVTSGHRVFLLKYDPNGTALWAYGGTSQGNEEGSGTAIVTDSSGTSYVTGYYSSQQFSFGSYTLTNTNQNFTGTTNDIFIVKYNSSGTILWAKSAGGISEDAGRDIGIDNNSDVYVTGELLSPVSNFGNLTLTNPVGVPSGGSNYNAFVAKYSSAGNPVWASNMNGTRAIGRGIHVSGNGDVYVAGAFKDPGMTIGSNNLVNSGANNTYDLFVAKYGAGGIEVWGKSAGGPATDIAYSIAIDQARNIFVTGTYSSSTIAFGNTTLTSAGANDVFVSKLENDDYLSISESDIAESILVFPVPCRDLIELRSSSPIVSVAMFNTLGQLVCEKNNPELSHEFKIDLQTLPEGSYLIRVSTERYFVWRKVVVSGL